MTLWYYDPLNDCFRTATPVTKAVNYQESSCAGGGIIPPKNPMCDILQTNKPTQHFQKLYLYTNQKKTKPLKVGSVGNIYNPLLCCAN